MTKSDDLCASSGSVVPEDGAVYCVCGRIWKNVERVPLHNMKGHPTTPEKLKEKIDRAWDALQRKRRILAEREQERREEFVIAMMEIERRKAIGRARRKIPTMPAR